MRQWACHRFHSRMNRLHQPTWYRRNRIVVLAGGRGGNAAAVLLIHHTTYDDGGEPIEFVEAVYPGGRWTFEDEYPIG